MSLWVLKATYFTFGCSNTLVTRKLKKIRGLSDIKKGLPRWSRQHGRVCQVAWINLRSLNPLWQIYAAWSQRQSLVVQSKGGLHRFSEQAMTLQQVTILFLRNALSLLLDPHRLRKHEHGTRGENATWVSNHELSHHIWVGELIMANKLDSNAHKGAKTRPQTSIKQGVETETSA